MYYVTMLQYAYPCLRVIRHTSQDLHRKAVVCACVNCNGQALIIVLQVKNILGNKYQCDKLSMVQESK